MIATALATWFYIFGGVMFNAIILHVERTDGLKLGVWQRRALVLAWPLIVPFARLLR